MTTEEKSSRNVPHFSSKCLFVAGFTRVNNHRILVHFLADAVNEHRVQLTGVTFILLTINKTTRKLATTMSLNVIMFIFTVSTDYDFNGNDYMYVFQNCGCAIIKKNQPYLFGMEV